MSATVIVVHYCFYYTVPKSLGWTLRPLSCVIVFAGTVFYTNSQLATLVFHKKRLLYAA